MFYLLINSFRLTLSKIKHLFYESYEGGELGFKLINILFTTQCDSFREKSFLSSVRFLRRPIWVGFSSMFLQ